VVLLLLATACVFVRPEPDRSLERVRAAGLVRIAIDPTYPPFADYTAEGGLAGFDVDLSQALAAELGVRPDFQVLDVTSAIDALLVRKVDLVISALPPYPEYTRDVTYSSPYFNAGLVLVSPATRPVTALAALSGLTVAVEQGSTAEETSRQQPGAHLRLTDGPETALALVGHGADAALLDRVSATQLTRSRTDLHVSPPVTFEPYVIAGRRQDAALNAAVEAALTRLRENGTLARLERQWLGG
jgi:ABC-type amino acid transport substrate-binding protein